MSSKYDYSGMVLCKKYKLISQIGCGGFGFVYEALNLLNNQKVAVKIELLKKKNNLLGLEYKVYQALSGQKGFAYSYDFGVEEKFRFLIMDLLGSTLDNLLSLCDKKFSLITTMLIADQVLSRIEQLHSKNYIHRDIKPENFAFGTEFNSGILYILDFGLAKKFKEESSGKHIPYRDGKSLTGSIRYASINSHLGIELTRRDDLESIGYLLVFLLTGNLPWQGIKESNKRRKMESVSNVKISTSIETICRTCPGAFIDYFFYVKKLKFEEKPDYNFLKNIFKELLYKESEEHPEKVIKFDWIKSSTIKNNLLNPIRTESTPIFLNTRFNKRTNKSETEPSENKPIHETLKENRIEKKIALELEEIPEIPNEGLDNILNKATSCDYFTNKNTLTAKKKYGRTRTDFIDNI